MATTVSIYKTRSGSVFIINRESRTWKQVMPEGKTSLLSRTSGGYSEYYTDGNVLTIYPRYGGRTVRSARIQTQYVTYLCTKCEQPIEKTDLSSYDDYIRWEDKEDGTRDPFHPDINCDKTEAETEPMF